LLKTFVDLGKTDAENKKDTREYCVIEEGSLVSLVVTETHVHYGLQVVEE